LYNPQHRWLVETPSGDLKQHSEIILFWLYSMWRKGFINIEHFHHMGLNSVVAQVGNLLGDCHVLSNPAVICQNDADTRLENG